MVYFETDFVTNSSGEKVITAKMDNCVDVHCPHSVIMSILAVCPALFAHQQIAHVSVYDFMEQRGGPALFHDKAVRGFSL